MTGALLLTTYTKSCTICFKSHNFVNCFSWHIVGLPYICSSWWNLSVSPFWLNWNQHINNLKQEGSIHILLDESGVQVANFMTWRFVSIGLTSRICVNIVDHLESGNLNCPPVSEGPQELNQVQRNYWFHVFFFTVLFPLRHFGKHQENII